MYTITVDGTVSAKSKAPRSSTDAPKSAESLPFCVWLNFMSMPMQPHCKVPEMLPHLKSCQTAQLVNNPH